MSMARTARPGYFCSCVLMAPTSSSRSGGQPFLGRRSSAVSCWKTHLEDLKWLVETILACWYASRFSAMAVPSSVLAFRHRS